MKSIFLSLCIVLASSCASRTEGWFSSGNQKTISKKEGYGLRNQAKKFWSARSEKESLVKALKVYEKLANSNMKSREVFTYLSRGYYFLADAHTEQIDEKKKIWEIGTSWGEKGLALNPQFAQKVKEGEKLEDHLDLLSKEDAPNMYWTAANLGKWAKNSGIATTLKYKNRIRSLVSKVEDLDKNYFYAAPYRYWGAYYAIAPGFAGGDINKSKKYFDKSIKLAPDYLGTYVLYAELYTTKQDDQDDYVKTLKYVINKKLTNKDLIPENLVEKKKAKKLLKEIEDRF